MPTLKDAFRSSLTVSERTRLDSLQQTNLHKLSTPKIVAGTLWQVFAEAGFKDDLIDGRRIATGFELPLKLDSKRKLLPLSIWPLLTLDIQKEEAAGFGLRLGAIEVFDQGDQHLLSAYDDEMDLRRQQSQLESVTPRDFYHFTHGGKEFRCGPTQAAVLHLLYQARNKECAWLIGKDVLREVKSESATIGDLFKSKKKPSWRLLIESDGRGLYRLNPSYVHQR